MLIDNQLKQNFGTYSYLLLSNYILCNTYELDISIKNSTKDIPNNTRRSKSKLLESITYDFQLIHTNAGQLWVLI